MQIEFKFVEQTFKVRDQEITFTEKIAYDENGTIQSKEIDKLIIDILKKGDD